MGRTDGATVSGGDSQRGRQSAAASRPAAGWSVTGPCFNGPVGLRVLIAEDEAIIRLDLRETLAEEGYDVVAETGRGDEAIEMARELRPDLAVLDIGMPGMDGLEAARLMVGEQLCGVLILTAFSQRELIEQARDAGALAYLVKPFQKSDLVPALELAHARHTELQALGGEVRSLEERLEARKVIDRAKGRLMDVNGLTEADAFSFIQKRAMNDRVRMKDVAQLVLDGELLP
jgi:two-component system, response regulator PdtaR